jgi:hypothetical protein
LHSPARLTDTAIMKHMRGSGWFFAVMILALASAQLPACGDDSSEHSEGVGNACEGDDDCETGECYLGPGGGYCTTECENEGSTDECPEDTVCKPIQGGPRRCLLVCGSESSCSGSEECLERHCPSGSSCVEISDTELEACEPDPT